MWMRRGTWRASDTGSRPGPSLAWAEIKIQGLAGIPEDQVRRTLGLKEGDLYSRAELDSAERALLDLGVFSAARVTPRLEEDRAKGAVSDVVPIEVEVQKSRFRSVHLGGGFQIDSQRTDVHVIAGWEDRNFFGGLRNFLVEFVPGAVLYPTRLPDLGAARTSATAGPDPPRAPAARLRRGAHAGRRARSSEPGAGAPVQRARSTSTDPRLP